MSIGFVVSLECYVKRTTRREDPFVLVDDNLLVQFVPNQERQAWGRRYHPKQALCRSWQWDMQVVISLCSDRRAYMTHKL